MKTLTYIEGLVLLTREDIGEKNKVNFVINWYGKFETDDGLFLFRIEIKCSVIFTPQLQK